MEIEFDAGKNERNIRTRGIAFTLAERFDFDTAVRAEDVRKNYGEQRIVAYGYIGSGTRLHVMCYKPISASCIRVISLRKANKREEKTYEKTIQAAD